MHALVAWARHRLDRGQGTVRSTSDFGGTGGGAPHERGSAITDSFDRVAEVERAVLATFEPDGARPPSIRGIPTRTCREVFLALTVGKTLAKKIGVHERLKAAKKSALAGTPRERTAPGWTHEPGVALLLAIQDWRQVASDRELDEQVVAVIVRHGLREVTDRLAAAQLVPARRDRGKERAMARAANRPKKQTDLLSGWKQIARYCKVSPPTARRMARRGMPISRDHNGWPLGDPIEIDRWRRGETPIDTPDEAA